MIPVGPRVQSRDNKVLSSFEVRQQDRPSAQQRRNDEDDNYPLKIILVDHHSTDHVTCSLPNNTSLTFPWQLHSLLEAAEREKFDHIVSWQDDKAFKIHNRPLFVKQIMPRFFKRQSKYKSFQRQLNLWQFQRLTRSRGPCHSGYFHPHFHRYNTSLFACMKRSIKQKSESPLRGHHDLVYHFQEQGSPQMASIVERAINCSTMTADDHEVRNITSSFISDESHQNNIDTKSPAPLDCAIMLTPYDQATTGSSSVPYSPSDHELHLHSQISSLGRAFPILRVAHEAMQLEYCWSKVEQVPAVRLHDHCCSSLSPQDDDIHHGDEISLPLHKGSSKEGTTAGGSSFPAPLSAAEWKYVLVGMEMAMIESG